MRCPKLAEFASPPPGKTGWPWTEESPQLPDTMADGCPWPRISIVTPSYNRGEFIEETIRSVLLQGYPDLEYFIIDGGSTDGGVEIIRKYEKWLEYWVSEPDRGQSHAINKGWERSSGDVLAWLNSDDFYYPGALANVARMFRETASILAICGAIAIVDADGSRLTLKEPYSLDPTRLFSWGLVPGQPGVFIRRSLFKELGGPRFDLHYVMDWEYWLRISLRYPSNRFAYTDEVLAASREWGGTKTNTAAGRSGAEVRRVLDDLLREPKLPEQLLSLRRHAYARTWWRQSINEYRNGARWRAVMSLFKAVFTSPMSFSPLTTLHQALRYLLT